ncbi:jg22460 [Pararge aegeria aegeria]|uniref:Jg22460 protein n=1 Tax=Pararge aegeria aegeria TaxID=348720 RepID=A0A8S4SGN5_9NEOP|nr:jg22460 [Pararge aegeria aegeria]
MVLEYRPPTLLQCGLILSALIACVSAAPSVLSPSPYAALSAGPWGVAPLLVAPSSSLGDIQAAVIDAQVKVADQARFLSDQAKDAAEKTIEDQNQRVVNANDWAKEKSEEAYWAAEEKKWQALNEAQIAKARLASSIANDVYIKAETTEEKAEINSDTIEVNSAEKYEVKTAEVEKPAAAEISGEAKMDNLNEAKAEAPQQLNSEQFNSAAATKSAIAVPKPEEVLAAFKSALAPITLLNPEGTAKEFATVPIAVPKLEDALQAYKSALEIIAGAKPEDALEAYVTALSPITRTSAKSEDFLKSSKSAFPLPTAVAPGFNFQPYIASLPYQGYNSLPLQYIPASPYRPTLVVKNVW